MTTNYIITATFPLKNMLELIRSDGQTFYTVLPHGNDVRAYAVGDRVNFSSDKISLPEAPDDQLFNDEIKARGKQ